MKLAKNNWNMAEPGVLYQDRINTWHLMSGDVEFTFAGVNPCLTGDTLIQTIEGIYKVYGHHMCMDENGKGKPEKQVEN